MLGSAVRATRAISPQVDVPITVLKPSSYQMLRALMWCIDNANATSHSSPTHNQKERRGAEATTPTSAARGVGEEVDDGIDGSGVGREVVAGDGDGARAVDAVGETL